MTIATFAWLIDPSVEHPSLDNGSVTVVAYENGKFTLEALGDMTYRQVGREIIEKENGKNNYPSRRQAKSKPTGFGYQ